MFAAQTIGNMLERNGATVIAHIDGLCASAATIVACHADKVVAAADASYMVHPPSMGVCDYLTAEETLADGKLYFHKYVATYLPAEAIEEVVEFDVSAIAEAMAS